MTSDPFGNLANGAGEWIAVSLSENVLGNSLYIDGPDVVERPSLSLGILVLNF